MCCIRCAKAVQAHHEATMENRDPGRISREDLVILAIQLREALVSHQAEFGTFNEFAKARASTALPPNSLSSSRPRIGCL
jgi:hypothetical protein